uniref:BTB domain-containing protein n=1 Tax=Panagrolaimus sp. JU765 TaxID=591449 RepID=A0AC34RNJ6_9BILA
MHKCILSTASPVFASMFRTHNPEVVCDIIRDYGYKVIEAAVNLMYKREFNADLTVKTLLNLFRFSKKYELVDEIQIFEKLVEKINVTTIRRILSFSFQHAMSELYQRCVDYFAKDFEVRICQINDLESLNMEFVNDVIKKYQVYKKKWNSLQC